MPLQRRVPKRGFTNIFRVEYAVVNLSTLEREFAAGEQVSPTALKAAGIVKSLKNGLKILGNGEISKALVVSAHKFSETAKKKIEAAGGRCEVLSA